MSPSWLAAWKSSWWGEQINITHFDVNCLYIYYPPIFLETIWDIWRSVDKRTIEKSRPSDASPGYLWKLSGPHNQGKNILKIVWLKSNKAKYFQHNLLLFPHIKSIIGPAAKLECTLLVIKRKPGDVHKAGGLEDAGGDVGAFPITVHYHISLVGPIKSLGGTE